MKRGKAAFELALTAVGSSEDGMPDQIEGLPVADPIPVGTDPGQARPNGLLFPCGRPVQRHVRDVQQR